jgi:hypothetical protein
VLIVPGTTDFRETPVLIRPLGAQDPQPYWGWRILRDNSLILVITGVEAGDRAPSHRSAGDRACASAVGGQRRPVVDTWTSRRLCTVVVRRPRFVPCLPPPRPQFVPRPVLPCRGDGVAAGQRGAGTVSTGAAPAAITVHGEVDMTPCDPAHTRSPQPVHIPGDNSSTSRPARNHRSPISRRPCGPAPSTAPSPPVDKPPCRPRDAPARASGRELVPLDSCSRPGARVDVQLRPAGSSWLRFGEVSELGRSTGGRGS